MRWRKARRVGSEASFVDLESLTGGSRLADDGIRPALRHSLTPKTHWRSPSPLYGAAGGSASPGTETALPPFIGDMKEVAMDWNRVEGNWKQMKGAVKQQWGKL